MSLKFSISTFVISFQAYISLMWFTCFSKPSLHISYQLSVMLLINWPRLLVQWFSSIFQVKFKINSVGYKISEHLPSHLLMDLGAMAVLCSSQMGVLSVPQHLMFCQDLLQAPSKSNSLLLPSRYCFVLGNLTTKVLHFHPRAPVGSASNDTYC